MPTTREDLQQRMQEIQARIDEFDRRAKHTAELKEWLTKRGLDHLDVLAIYRQLKPKRSDTPVRSKKPLFAPGKATLKHVKKTQDGKKFYVTEDHVTPTKAQDVRFVSPDGRFVWSGKSRVPPWFEQHIRAGGKPEDLLLAGRPLPPKMNGAAAHV